MSIHYQLTGDFSLDGDLGALLLRVLGDDTLIEGRSSRYPFTILSPELLIVATEDPPFVDWPSQLSFRLRDKDRSQECGDRVVDCILAVLQHTSEDLVFEYESDRLLLARKSGHVNYSQGERELKQHRRFWNRYRADRLEKVIHGIH